MNVLVAGANGNTGRQIVELLAEEEHTVRALIRDNSQAEEMIKIGAQPVLGDLEQDIGFAVEGCDAVIFAAGSGSHTGPDKTIAVDQEGAIKLIKAAENNAANRFIMLSAMGTDRPEEGPEKLRPYLEAKAKADKALVKSKLNYTILRPGLLTNGEATGKIRVSEKLSDNEGDISRADVARTIVSALQNESTYRQVFELLSGDTPIDGALTSLSVKNVNDTTH